MFYPWLSALWQTLDRQVKLDRLHHAQLLHSQANMGVEDFAVQYAKRLLCHAPVVSEDNHLVACERCKSCHLFTAGSHPDFQHVHLLEKKQMISISQIRAIETGLATSAISHRGKVVILQEADTMNNAAMNALLKVLEEPPNRCQFFIVTRSLHQLLPTIRSRCQQQRIAPPERGAAIEWLEQKKVKQAGDKLSQAQGYPLKVLDWEQEKVWSSRREIGHELNALFDGARTAKAKPCWQRMSLDETYALSQYWLHGMVKSLTTDIKSVESELPAWRSIRDQLVDAALASSSHGARLSAWRSTQLVFRFYDKLVRRRSQVQENPNLNQQVLADELLLDWQALAHTLKATASTEGSNGQARRLNVR